MFNFRDRKTINDLIGRLKRNREKLMFMHICGTHQDTIFRFGLNRIFNDCNIEVREGPGCPVCVTTTREIEESIRLAEKGKIVTTYGDMTQIPGMRDSLQTTRAKGGKIKAVYSIEDALRIARENKNKDVVFMAVGFETTAPSTAATVLSQPPDNFYILSCHRLIPPAVKTLLELGEMKIDGFIEPGHVSTIIGVEPYLEISERYHVPQVIAGFEPLDIISGVIMLVNQIERGEAKVENEYIRAVSFSGNTRAKEILSQVFDIVDVKWRGFDVIPRSGMELKEKFDDINARKVFEDEIGEIEDKGEIKGCICDKVLRGIATPKDCKLFGKVCKPSHPVGPCMVSREGSCYIELKYGN